MLHPDHARVQAALRREPDAVDWLAARLECVPRMVQQVARRFPWLPASERPDVAQDVVLVVLRRLDSYHGQAPLEAWVHRACLLTVRGRARRRIATGGVALDGLAAAADDDRPGARLLAEELRVRIRQAVDAVGGVEAEILRQRHFAGLDFETIAQRTGIGIATLRTRYYRALKSLQRRLAGSLAAEDRSP
jgi:RNA polymerase sigma factor (sigma-70 family)